MKLEEAYCFLFGHKWKQCIISDREYQCVRCKFWKILSNNECRYGVCFRSLGSFCRCIQEDNAEKQKQAIAEASDTLFNSRP